ncbi:MAG: hypothetical protein GAK41_01586 [Burkholderia gladioli]|nr:MAG: hypothetical protein GAK41_01586 [Burkholderia gladioli]
MLAAIGLLLIVKQVPFALGLHGDTTAFSAHAIGAAVIAAASLALLIAWDLPALRRFALVRNVPAPLVVVAIGIVATLALTTLLPGVAPPAEHRVALPALDSLASLGGALQAVEFGPHFAQLWNPDVWRMAITLAIVASLETLLSLEAVEQIDPKRRPPLPNRELKAQGVGNLAAGAFTELINLIPLATLAAILIHTGFKLAKPKLFHAVAKQGPAAFIPFVATIAGVLAADLLFGIALGIVISVLTVALANLRSPATLAQHDDHYLLTFRKDVSFLGKVQVKRYLRQIPDRAIVIVDATRADTIDHDVRELIDAFIADAPAREILVDYRQPLRANANRWSFSMLRNPGST